MAAAAPFIPDVDAMLTMSPSACAFINGTTRLVMSTSPKTLVSNIVAHRGDVHGADLAAIGVAGVVDEHVHAAHLRHARLHGEGVLVALADVGDESEGAGLGRHLLDRPGVTAGEHH